MAAFDITMKHTEASLEALAHMQYDLFCRSNRVVRTILSAGMVLLGVIMHEKWWSILAIAYGCYLTTSTYASANRTAHKLTAQIRASGADFPGSRFLFDNDGMHIRPLPEKEGEKMQSIQAQKCTFSRAQQWNAGEKHGNETACKHTDLHDFRYWKQRQPFWRENDDVDG